MSVILTQPLKSLQHEGHEENLPFGNPGEMRPEKKSAVSRMELLKERLIAGQPRSSS
jgi:hypothetical protein